MRYLPLEKICKTSRHTTFYNEAGPVDGTPIIFVHGWPELGVSWRHQLACFANLGFRVIAPDMRGYGRSSLYAQHEDYAVEHIVTDMIELLDSLDAERAIWVGHDWGSPIVWSIGAHYPERCHALINLCVPYIPQGFARANLIPLVDRTIYPEEIFLSGQWAYWDHYVADFKGAARDFEANVGATIRGLFRRGNPDAVDAPEITARVTNEGGFGFFIDMLRDLPLDELLITQEEHSQYVAALTRASFFGPNSWYLNDARNIAYAARAHNGGRIDLHCLFVSAAYDVTCKTAGTRLGDPMRQSCSHLTEMVIKSGHWMAQEKPVELNSVLARWLIETVPHLWPKPA
ncbi:MAG: alpha/beta hydrolase [Sphingobium sp.]|uniref:alpha/beta hydrolase n=1 Tax=Sphingobium sp. CECT 9361 TaxID=2845384 RepID=UPI001E5CF55D|nr:alpha/beta hydrolase [Sphingobium sp. CECT 9361]CAH0357091.1 Epoxide hydrolase A [Sphingobium sp. CECT 9361]